MRKLGKVILGMAAFLVMSGFLLALMGRIMGAETSLTFERNGHTIEITPHGIIGFNSGRWGGYDYDYDYGNDYEYEYEYVEGYDQTAAGSIPTAPEPPKPPKPPTLPVFALPTGYQGQKYTDGARDMAAFQSLNLELDLGDVVVKTGDDYGVELNWYGRDYSLHYAVEDGVLRVWSTEPNGWINHPGNQYGGYVTIFLPKGAALDDVYVQADMGGVYLEGFSAKTLEVTANLGAAVLTGITAREADLRLDLGSITMGSCKITDSLDVSCNLGSVEVLGGTLLCAVSVEASMGSVTLSTGSPVESYSYDLNADLGSITLNGETQRGSSLSRSSGAYDLSVNCSTGSIDIIFA